MTDSQIDTFGLHILCIDDSKTQLRITSYNVCYTKLLRHKRPPLLNVRASKANLDRDCRHVPSAEDGIQKAVYPVRMGKESRAAVFLGDHGIRAPKIPVDLAVSGIAQYPGGIRETGALVAQNLRNQGNRELGLGDDVLEMGFPDRRPGDGEDKRSHGRVETAEMSEPRGPKVPVCYPVKGRELYCEGHEGYAYPRSGSYTARSPPTYGGLVRASTKGASPIRDTETRTGTATRSKCIPISVFPISTPREALTDSRNNFV